MFDDSVDLTFAGVGVFGGVPGAVVGGAYFVGDITGFNSALAKTPDGKPGARSTFMAIGSGDKPFGQGITSIIVDQNTRKVTVRWQQMQTGSRIPQTKRRTVCVDKDKC